MNVCKHAYFLHFHCYDGLPWSLVREDYDAVKAQMIIDMENCTKETEGTLPRVDADILRQSQKVSFKLKLN